MKALFDKTFDRIAFMLDYRSERQKILTANVANMDSVDYEPKDLVFASHLESAMKRPSGLPLTRTDPGHLPAGPALSRNDLEVVPMGDTVVLDEAMMKLTENQLQYNTEIEMLGRKFRIVNNVLREVM